MPYFKMSRRAECDYGLHTNFRIAHSLTYTLEMNVMVNVSLDKRLEIGCACHISMERVRAKHTPECMSKQSKAA